MTGKGDLGLPTPQITLWQGDCLEKMKGIPLDEGYFKIAQDRINKQQKGLAYGLQL